MNARKTGAISTLLLTSLLMAWPAMASEGGGSAPQGEGEIAMGTLFALLGIAILLWVIGNLLIGYRYDTGGPKGGPLERR